MNGTANKYEVEMKVSRAGRHPRVVTRVEYAYNVIDAFMQANINHAGENEGETCDRLIRVAPPIGSMAVAISIAPAISADGLSPEAAKSLREGFLEEAARHPLPKVTGV
jgi:hypothetical protein